MVKGIFCAYIGGVSITRVLLAGMPEARGYINRIEVEFISLKFHILELYIRHEMHREWNICFIYAVCKCE